jgi:hypothetical protein
MANARAGFGLAGFRFNLIALIAVGKQLGFLTQALRLFSKTLFEGLDMFESVSLLHGPPPDADWEQNSMQVEVFH